ncbi:4-hydroxy-3-methylbut-2-enyl diphosphate reductase [Rhodoluna lacicola]|uniref:4-hydroxy-3-methylbut-2-enyl diphosphate reductase n=1 Tax=Rhodoluna lacicola TaxID=529884 RepID=A0A060JGD2_9MICO|nr:4-hydroxy-3-methylbut-2-enyl diphosphate reductase [Rhodoluna lacicola]AIC47785.1 (E)-4-hydroxy-3-methyl-but-2-enyl pyrophosphate reductase (IPP and DMAPP forming) [Rhodoluna lacicola]BDS50690.1 4-hydroxy-3-methylbut-2-enyl diphosphate reductase [Rhodoluna lacicola]
MTDIKNTAGKKVLLASPRGYCAGVDRAVIAVEKALDHYGSPVYVRKQIVHNKHVVSSLEARGAIFVEEVDEVPPGSVLVFSAHGVSPAVVAAAAERGLNTIDATCPLVTKVHREVQRFAAEDYDILLIGHEGHEEVEGTAGEAPHAVQIIDKDDSIAAAKVRDPKKLIWLSQTTLSVDETMETVLKLREKHPTLQNPPSDDICYATQNRQVAIKKVGAQSDLVIVVGSANSSNTVRLVEVALDAGAKASHRVDFASEIKEEWFEGVETVGVSSGASVPEELVDEVLEYLANRGYGDVRTVQTAEEDIQFSLPAELRKELKAAGHETSNKAKRD